MLKTFAARRRDRDANIPVAFAVAMIAKPLLIALTAASLALASLLFGNPVRAATSEGDVAGDGIGLEEIIVEGEQPGPGLWKITKGANVLWMLGTYAPLPQRITWRSKQVEEAIAASSEVLGVYSISLRVRNANQSKVPELRKVLPASAYSRWRGLRDKYIARDARDERLLPAAAALLLQSQAYERSGLTYSDELWRTIYALARKHSVPVIPQDFTVEPPAPQRSSRSAKQAGVRYLVETMDRLDRDIIEARARANTWAVGDLEALIRLAETDASYARLRANSWPFLTEQQAQTLTDSAQNQLLVRLERAMKRNQQTFAALPIHVLVGHDGVLARLSAGGCRIEAPR